jgi:hypothetical protein
MCVCLSVPALSACLPACPVCLSVCLPALSVCLSCLATWLSIQMSVTLSVCLPNHLCIRTSIYM